MAELVQGPRFTETVRADRPAPAASWGVDRHVIPFIAGQVIPTWSDPPVGSPGPESISLQLSTAGPDAVPGPGAGGH